MTDEERAKLIEALKKVTLNPTEATKYEKGVSKSFGTSLQEDVEARGFSQNHENLDVKKAKDIVLSIKKLEEKVEKILVQSPQDEELENLLGGLQNSDWYKKHKQESSQKYQEALQERHEKKSNSLSSNYASGSTLKQASQVVDTTAQATGAVLGIVAGTYVAAPVVAVVTAPYTSIKTGSARSVQFGVKSAIYTRNKVKSSIGTNSRLSKVVGEVVGDVAALGAGISGFAVGFAVGAVEGPVETYWKTLEASAELGRKTRGLGLGYATGIPAGVVAAATLPIIKPIRKAFLEESIRSDKKKITSVAENIAHGKSQTPELLQNNIHGSDIEQQVVNKTRGNGNQFNNIKDLLEKTETQSLAIEEARKISQPISQQSMVEPQKQTLSGRGEVETFNPNLIKIQRIQNGEFMMFRESEHGLPPVTATYKIENGEAKCSKIVLPPETDGWKIQREDDVIKMVNLNGKSTVLCSAVEFDRCQEQSEARQRTNGIQGALSLSHNTPAVQYPTPGNKKQERGIRLQ
jgi:hypothetical protein